MILKKTISPLILLVCTQASVVHAALWDKVPTQTDATTQTQQAATANSDFPAWQNLTPKSAPKTLEAAVKRAKSQIETITQLPEKQMNFDTVYREYDRIMSEYEDVSNELGFIHLVKDLDAWEDASNKIADIEAAFTAWLGENEALKDAFYTVGDEIATDDFNDQHSYYIYTTLQQLAETGCDLDDTGKKKLNQLLSKLSEAEYEYEYNIAMATNECTFLVANHEKELLDGLPDELIEDALEAAMDEKMATKQKPAWLFIADNIIICTAAHEEMRKRAWQHLNAAATKEPYDNAPIIAQILSLREEIAQMHDYDSFADLEASKTMIAATETAVDLLDVVHQFSMPQYEAYMEELRRYIARKANKTVERINPWDVMYYVIQRDEEQYKFDQSEFCQYFPYEHVRDYCFKYFGELFGLKIQEITSAYAPVGSGKAIKKGAVSVWDPKVQVYSVHDSASGRYMGAFYLDAFYRDEKAGGAWAFSIKNAPKIKALCVDITPSANGEPDVLTGEEMHSLVHEFGHVLHFIMSNTELTCQSSDETAQDFVETPSQLLEQWLLERSFLKALSKHTTTGKSIPDKLLNAYIATRDSFRIVEDVHHLNEVKLDLEMHLNYSSKFKGKNLNIATRKALKGWDVPMSTLSSSPAYCMDSCMTGGYSAKYYSYIWSKMLVSDIFSRFKKEGLNNKKVGMELREKVLSKGASIPPIFLIEDFLGREVEPLPYFQQQGYVD